VSLPRTHTPDEAFWNAVRARFPVTDLAYLNTANAALMALPVLESLERNTRVMASNPSSATREKFAADREESRRLVAEALGATPEEIVLTRNASESNNFISSGLTLGPGDEVLVFADNHPSNLDAWRAKARRFGFAVSEVPATLPHPGADFYLSAFERAITARTRLLSITHVTNTVGDLLPVKDLCALARSRGVMSLVDGAQSFGVMEVNLAEMRPDIFSSSTHKWLCGPRDMGVLFVSAAAQHRIAPSVVGLYPGAVGFSRTMEAFGQRGEAAFGTLGAAVMLQREIGIANIARRARSLAQRLTTGVSGLPGVTMYSSTDASRYVSIVSFKPGALDPDALAAALYDKDHIACAHTSGRPGLRFSPHVFNTPDEIDRVIDAVGKYLARGKIG